MLKYRKLSKTLIRGNYRCSGNNSDEQKRRKLEKSMRTILGLDINPNEQKIELEDLVTIIKIQLLELSGQIMR